MDRRYVFSTHMFAKNALPIYVLIGLVIFAIIALLVKLTWHINIKAMLVLCIVILLVAIGAFLVKLRVLSGSYAEISERQILVFCPSFDGYDNEGGGQRYKASEFITDRIDSVEICRRGLRIKGSIIKRTIETDHFGTRQSEKVLSNFVIKPYYEDWDELVRTVINQFGGNSNGR